jgi:hypothetical protein
MCPVFCPVASITRSNPAKAGFNYMGPKFTRLPPQDKRKFVEALIEKIVIGNGEIDITFSHLPSSEELCKNHMGLTPHSGGKVFKVILCAGKLFFAWQAAKDGECVLR